jgi:acyl phosphate:glycerol-3-phosphate acyltransferase
MVPREDDAAPARCRAGGHSDTLRSVDTSQLRDVAVVLAAYLLGSLPVGVIIARATGGRDPRTVGSGRTGGTNVLRAMGPRRAVLVGLLDIGKGAAGVLLARSLGAGDGVVAVAGIATILGASKSVFLGFRGGRGVATGFGATLLIEPLAVLAVAPVFFIVVGVSRYVSLGSLLGSAAAAVVLAGLVWAGAAPQVFIAYGAAGAALVWLAHADNIDRLVHGQERRLSFSRRPPG